MRIRTLALSTFGSLVRNRLLILFGVVFVCVVLVMMTPLLGAKAMSTASNAQQVQAMVLGMVSAIMSFVSGFGSLLAAWAAADAVAGEMKSGTILAVMARPVKRWEFLAGKYAGVMILMAIYVAMMFGLSYLLAWMGGERIQSTTWVLLVYPMVRYAIYAGMAILLVTMLSPIVTLGILVLFAVLAAMVAPGSGAFPNLRNWEILVRTPLYYLLPSTTLLSEDRFLSITQASLKQTGWLEHVTTLAYGLDYAVICVLLAMWSFHFRSLKRD